ncbi:MAG: exopolyphosphatase [Bacteroidota bacterium]
MEQNTNNHSLSGSPEPGISARPNQLLAVIDMGTNTFHLSIVSVSPAENLPATSAGHKPTAPKFKSVYSEKTGVKLGEKGINKGHITEAAIQRALDTMRKFAGIIKEHGLNPADTMATATSAVRCAENGKDFCSRIFAETGISVNVIGGNEEATLIYEGVKAAGGLNTESYSLLMDIGGGSVEFIIGNQAGPVWMQSFEIGCLRLVDLFVQHDPILPEEIGALHTHALNMLQPMFDAAKACLPRTLAGSSGTFDTLYEMYAKALPENKGSFSFEAGNCYALPVEAYRPLAHDILHKNREDRLAMPGMIPLRVDLAVPAVCLIDLVLAELPFPGGILVSTYALKEGVLTRALADSARTK